MDLYDIAIARKLSGGGGGGGSSDFTFVTVTINNEVDRSAYVFESTVNEQYTSLFYNNTENCIYKDEIEIQGQTSTALNYAYLGAYGYIYPPTSDYALNITISGNIENISTTQFGETFDVYKITGDCTITIS